MNPAALPADVRASGILVATGNAGKLLEMGSLFGAYGIDVRLPADYVSPLEGEHSYAENAALKARTLHERLDDPKRAQGVLADDSGLEVFALDGRPGVLTAGYGGAGASWPQRRALLLAELPSGTDRRARFVCALHYIGRDGRECASFGTVDGEIAADERGELGFSFDPVFWYPPARRTFGELRAEQKNRISHRAIAVAAIVAAIDASARALREA